MREDFALVELEKSSYDATTSETVFWGFLGTARWERGDTFGTKMFGGEQLSMEEGS